MTTMTRKKKTTNSLISDKHGAVSLMDAALSFIVRYMKDFKFDGQIKMVALDLDGTTLNSEREITPRTIAAFEACKVRGVHVVVSTGRTYSSLPENVTGAPGIEFAITSNGAHINYIKTGEAIYSDYLDPGAVEEVARLKETTGAYIEVFIDGIAYTDESYLEDVRQNGCAYRSAEYVLWSRKGVPDVSAFMLENKDIIENVNFIYETVERLEECRPQIEAINNATITSSFPNNLEVGGPNTSKKTALIELMSRLGVDRSELMCCGDAPNDIQMMEYAAVGVAVANAWGGTKDHADYITDSNDDDGVAKAIEHFVLK